MKVFMVSTKRGWGRGASIEDAIKAHDQFSRKIRKNESFTLYTFEAKDPSDVWIDDLGMQWHSQNYAKFLTKVTSWKVA